MSFSFGVVNVVGVEVFGDSLSHGGPVEVDPVRVVDDTVEDGVGECRFADDVVPFVDGQLAGDQDGGVLVSVLDDFHEVGSLIGAEAVGSPIVEDEEIGLGESTEMRPALECAGQVVSMFKDLYGKAPGAENRISRYLNADYYQTIIRLSRGQMDHREILEQINAAVPTRSEPVRKIRSFRESEKVKDLEFGEIWYGHLSDCFFHSELPALKNHSYFGGVGPQLVD